ncbi:MAG: tRNA lysidine(34) synthetase TilS [Rubrobacteridae bacterium]|nr:tRNA lysidine(34) synthetase TilS [Rubrobacteridae bacterium]
MLEKGDKIIVAVSGGPDSVALLHFFKTIEDDYDLKLHTFHLNHKIRGEEADKDESYVASLALKFNLPVSLLNFDVKAFADSEGLSIEEAAREARYGQMDRLAKTIGADRVALAHHADDQIETFLMRLIRGAGIDGLSAIRPVRDIYIRPFLNIRKEDILAYLAENNLEYRIDASNEDLSILRNRVRHELVPLLIDYNPRFKESVLKTIEITNEEQQYLKSTIEELFKRIAATDAETVSFAVDDLKEQVLAVRRRLIRRGIAEVKSDLRGIEFAHIEKVMDGLANQPAHVSVDMPGGIVVFSEYEQLIITKRDRIAEPFSGQAINERLLKVPGMTVIDEIGAEITAEFIDPAILKFEKNGMIAHLDADKIEGRLIVRSRRPGDSFRPFGSEGEKKLQDYFVDVKLARRKRDRVPVITMGEDIVWVAGYRMDNRFRVTAATRRVLVLKLRNGFEL